MQNQFFINEISCNFNLRKPKVNDKPTNVYCVIYQKGKQHYFATGLKVLPSQWNKRKQIAVVSNTLSPLDNHNNNILNKKIDQLKGFYEEYIKYLCNNPYDTTKLNSFIYKDMVKRENKHTKASYLIERALNIYLSNNQCSENTIRNYKNRLSAFCDYITNCNLNDNIELLTQRGLNNYLEYLQNEASKLTIGQKGGGVSNINQKCQFVALMINDILSNHNEFIDLHIQPVKYKSLNDKRNKDNRSHFPLTTDEIAAIENVTGLNERQTIYRDLFILQCNCGQRTSDLKQLVIGNYTKDAKGFIHLNTKKEKITAYFPETDKIKKLMGKLCSLVYIEEDSHFIKTGDTKINIDKLDRGALYNVAIKAIAKKANLNRIRKYSDPQGRPMEDPIYKIISSHCARHSFATIMRDKGFEANEVCLMLGHADETMVNEVYAHNDENLKTSKLEKAINRVEGKTKDIVKSKINVLQGLFAYDKLKDLEAMKDYNINILPLSNQCTSIIKDTSKLNRAIQLMESAPKEKQKEFIDKVKELDKIIWYIGKHTADTSLYSIYEYKCKCLGIIDKITEVDLLNNIWQQELLQENTDKQI